METLLTTAILAGIALVSFIAGYLLTDWRGPLINVKPLNCRPCATFWLTIWIGIAALTLLHASYCAPGLLPLALLMFTYLKTQYKVHD